MRLLKLQDGKVSLTKFDKDPPKYAIMSHTWGAAEDEVQFEDVAQDKAEKRKGYEKIKFCAKQAASHNLEYFWVDTCCINKADVQEFQSAINLMFRWYQNAEICFVYMADVVTDSTGEICQEEDWKECFRNSRWFTRSWTLQELLSPRQIEFYSREHQCLGNRESLEEELHLITGIPASAFYGTGLSQFSTDQRISWARGRESTFEEDQAYSLLGLCDVAMAPNYGEGAKAAFKRLRKRCDKKLSAETSPVIEDFIIRSDLNNASPSHQLSSPGSSIVALVVMFNTCLDGLRQIDTSSDHSTDLSAAISQFGANIQMFKDWGKAVGIDGQRLGHGHHARLNDPEVSSAVQKIFATIQGIADKMDEGSSEQQHGLDAMSFRGQAQDSRQLRLGKSREVVLHNTKMEWTSRRKARFIALSQHFGSLVGSLQAFLPLETSKFTDLMAGQAHRGYLLSDNVAFHKSVRSINNVSHQLDLERIIIESKKRLERDMKRELDDWLSASFTIATYNDSIQKKLPDTCDWITDREVFNDWESANFCAKVLWINGPAGYGKTVLSAWIVQHLKARDDLPLAFFFFSADLEDRADPFVVIRSWISQITTQNQDAFDLAYRKLETHKGQAVSSVEMMELFKEIIQRVPNCTCIVDGLDECSSKGGWSTMQSNTLATFIRMTIQALSGTSSRVLIVSRDDQQIRKGFVEMSSTASTGIQMLEYKITPDDVKPDATKLSYSLVDQKLNRKSTELRAEIAKRIVDRCDSMFLRIKLLENDIRGGKNQRQLERIVDQAPTELHDLYDRNWARIMSRGTNDRARALAILRWVAFGLRPITIFEMTEALLLTDLEDIDDFESELPDDIDEPYVQTEILELCESLVETRAGATPDNFGLRTLHLTHATVRQYILLHLPIHAGQLGADKDLTSSNELAQHNILAEACLRYLGISSLWNKGQCEESINELKGSFRNYAMDSWNKHAKHNGLNYTIVSRLMVSFFCSANDSWEVWRRHFDAAQAQSRMLQYEGDITTGSKLFYATLLGLQDVFEALIKNVSTDINHVDESNRTAAFAAAHEGRLGLLQILLERKADINKASNEGRTPIYVASHNGHIDIVKFLLEKGADITITNQYGWTPLNCASSEHLEVVKLLIEEGADLTIANIDGRRPLYSASDSGNIEVVKLLLEKGADPNIADIDGWTALRVACLNGHVEVAKLLLDKGADLTIVDKNGWTPLNSASDNGHIGVVKLLLEQGADHTIANKDGQTPLYRASRYRHSEVVKLLLEKGADPNTADNDGWTALRVACLDGYVEVAKLLLDKGADLTIADKTGWTPLNSASENGHIEVVKLLLEQGAEPNIPNTAGWTPLNSASNRGHLDVVNLLLRKGADITISNKEGCSPLYSAATNGHLNVVKLLYEQGADMTVSDNDRLTPLHNAAYSGYSDVVKFLLENGSDITAVGKEGITPLHNAAFNSHLDIVKLLLEHGADIMAVGKDGTTTLHNAAFNGHLDVIKLLLENGADIMAVGKDGVTPLHNAAFKGHLDVVKLLIENGASITSAGRDGITPEFGALHNAALNGHSDVVKYLVENGADVMSVSKGGITPLHNAAFYGHVDVGKHLLENGASVMCTSKDGITPLYNAVINGHLDMIILLIKYGANVTDVSEDGITMLHAAALKGHLDVAKLLLENGADVMGKSKTRITPLDNAAVNGHLDVVKLLIKNGADVMGASKDEIASRYGPLHNAAVNGHSEVAKLLIENGADVMAIDKNGITPIHNAAFNGHLDVVKLLVENGASVKAISKDGITPDFGALHNAALNGHLDVVKFLVENGADVMSVGKDDIAPLHNAAYNGHLDVVNFLLENGTDISTTSKNTITPLHNATFNGHLDMVKLLIEKGFDVNGLNKDGISPLDNAAIGGYLDVVKLLVDNGADIMGVSKDGTRPDYGALHKAALNGHLKVAKYLVENGADIMTLGKDGATPLHIAARGGHLDIVKFLFEKGAELAITNEKGWTPLYIASSNGHVEVVKFLFEKGADITVADIHGWTPLHIAAKSGYDEVVEALCQMPCVNTSKQDNNGRTAIFFASMYGNQKVLNLLLSKCPADINIEDNYKATPLFSAVRREHMRAVATLLASSTLLLDSEDCFGRNVHYWARRTDDSRLLDLIDLYAQSASNPDPAVVESLVLEPPTPRSTSAWCDVCTMEIGNERDNYICSTCDGGEFWICMECFEFGVQCQDQSHKWRFVKGVQEPPST